MTNRRVDDHSWWAGKGSTFPEGVKTKEVMDLEQEPKDMMYEDTAETTLAAQKAAMGKMNAHAPKDHYRH